MGTFQRMVTQRLLPSLIVGLAAAWVLFTSMPGVPIHSDEYGWIRSGYYHTDLLIRREGALEAWEGRVLGPWGSLNMPLGKWILGFPLVAYRSATGRQLESDRGAGVVADQAGNVIPGDVLRVARSVSVVVSALICIAVFFLGARLGGPWTGLAAAGLTLATGYFRRWGARAATDAPYLLFLVLGCLAGVSFLEARSLRGTRKLALVCGSLAGLACSIKVSGLPLGLGFFAACLLHRIRLGLTTWREASALAGLFLATSLVVIYALDPFLWPTMRPADPRGYRAAIEASCQGFDRSSGLPPMAPRMIALRSAPALRFPALFVRWKALLDSQRARGLGQWRGSRWIGIHRTLLSPSATFLGGGLLLLAGLLWAIPRLWRSVRDRTPDPWVAPALFVLVQYLFLLFLMNLNWDRYYLPTLVGGQILAGGAVVAGAGWVRAKLEAGRVIPVANRR